MRPICLVRSISIIEDVLLDLLIQWFKSLAGILFLSVCLWLPEPGMGALVQTEKTTRVEGDRNHQTTMCVCQKLNRQWDCHLQCYVTNPSAIHPMKIVPENL